MARGDDRTTGASAIAHHGEYTTASAAQRQSLYKLSQSTMPFKWAIA
ncbi:MAG: hypothetical protein H7Z11_05480 [Verrucomicrobia bacterium]|nr:hypothetical protein [Leptolyngbya sp. ES-bin-22]